jgi:methylmalonyl-CoA/ethylmalonyl-CoA epimerase
VDQSRLHHVGFVVSSIEVGIEGFKQSLGAGWNGLIFHDPIQKVRVTFIQTQGASDASIELVEPAAEDSPVTNFLRKGGGLHHLCYEVSDLDEQLKEMRGQNGLIVKKPAPAVAFSGRRIAWVLTAQKLLLEFLEAQAPVAEP